MRKALALLKKDFLMETSYRFAFFFNVFGVLTSLATYFFIDRLFGNAVTRGLEEFGVNYFSYVLVSMAFFGYVGVGIGSFAGRIQSEQAQGTLEAILLTPTRISTILISLALWNLILATVDMLIYIGLAVFAFKINFTNVNILSTTLIFILTIFSFSAVGIISASFIMVFKRGVPFDWIVGSLEGLIGGVYFPISILPGWLQLLAQFLPITHAIKAVQLAVYKGYTPAQLSKELIILSLFTIILLPFSLWVFKYSLRIARRDGTLGQY